MKKKWQRQVNHAATALDARQAPGRWVKGGEYSTDQAAASVSRMIRSGHLRQYEPAGAYGSTSYREATGYALWVRYVGDTVKQPPVPRTMAVRLLITGEDGPEVVKAVIPTRCPASGCGAPRGFDTVRSVQDADGRETDTWTNPCGHVDDPAAVLAENVGGRATRDAGHAPMTPPVRLLFAAAGEGRIRHGSHAARLLEEKGYADEAALVRGQLRNNNGHLSARQAISFLRDLTRGAR